MLWNLYSESQKTYTRPSELLGLRQLEHELTGFRGKWCGWWAARQFDSACIYFGTWVESKLNEYDDKTHKPKHSLEALLSDGKGKLAGLPVGKSSPGAFQKLAGMFKVKQG